MNHDPLCPLTEPCGPDSYRHGFCSHQQEHCIHCYRDCACALIALPGGEDALAAAIAAHEAQQESEATE